MNGRMNGWMDMEYGALHSKSTSNGNKTEAADIGVKNCSQSSQSAKLHASYDLSLSWSLS